MNILSATDFPDLNILSCVDLADITKSPGQLYQLLESLYRTEFRPDERIVFYTSFTIPDKLWQHLYQATDKIDISNFFILICSTEDISIQCSENAQKWSQNGSSFNTMTVPLISSQPLHTSYVIHDSICPLPWMHLEVKNNGNISPCCVYNGSIGNISETPLLKVFESQQLNQIRQTFLNGGKPSGCSFCWKNEDNKVTSNRQRHLSILSRDLSTHYIDSPKLVSIDLKPGNTCNFKCRICNSFSSSLWAQEKQVIPVSAFQNWADEKNPAFNQILDQIPTINNYDLYGGEPFLIKPLTLLVEKIVSAGRAPDVRLHYNSNGSIWPNHLLPYWPHFQHIDLHFSIDNVGKRFELERGGQWDQVQSNIRRLIEKNLSNLQISIMPAISIMNVLYIDELFDWAKSLGLTVAPLYLQNPEHLSIERLTPSAKSAVLAKYKFSQHPELQKIVKVVENSPGSDGKQFIKYQQHLDKIRQQNFFSTHTEIAEAMGYIV
jgi:MoaA/NifB/PqqE/SkfB family radical SAM enzyme